VADAAAALMAAVNTLLGRVIAARHTLVPLAGRNRRRFIALHNPRPAPAGVRMTTEKLMNRLIVAAAVAMSLTGCATIFSGETQPVTFRSEPDTAAIAVVNKAGEKIHAGTTPVTLTLKRGAGYFQPEEYRVRVAKDGFKPVELTVTGSVNGWYIGNLLFGGLIGMLIVDPMTGAMFNLAPDSVSATLEAEAIKTSRNDGSLVIVLAQDVPAETLKLAQRIR
jgi:hypothetical protein